MGALLAFVIAVSWALSSVPTAHSGPFSLRNARRIALRPTPGDADGDGIPDALEDELLQRYSPTALLAADDASLPASIDWVRRRSAIAAQKPGVMTRHLFNEETRRGSRNPADWTMYGHAFPREGGGIVLQYWYFFPFNAGRLVFFDHEGDWEHVSVELDAHLAPEQFILSQHNNNAPGVRIPWSRVPREGDHPVHVVAWGSHAAYLYANQKPFWERAVDCPRRGDGTPVLDQCPVLAWRAGGEPGRPSPVVNIGEPGAPRLDSDPDAFIMRYARLWGDAAVLRLFSPAPAGPPYQEGFCADAPLGSCDLLARTE